MIRRVRPERVLCVGDLFTKGPDPVGVYALIREHDVECVLGNHDDRLLAAFEPKKGRKKDADALAVIEALDAAHDGWREWLAALPLWREAGGWTIVHAGLHPTQGVKGTTRDMALTMRRFPDEKPTDPYWHEIYKADRRVVFGHDAKKGLVRVEKERLPVLVGIDTGCVYGGKLTGYILEEDRILQIPAVRAYAAVG